MNAEAVNCPATHPWAVGEGSHCCQTYQVSGDPLGLLVFEDPVTKCFNNELIKCRIPCRTLDGGKVPNLAVVEQKQL